MVGPPRCACRWPATGTAWARWSNPSMVCARVTPGARLGDGPGCAARTRPSRTHAGLRGACHRGSLRDQELGQLGRAPGRKAKPWSAGQDKAITSSSPGERTCGLSIAYVWPINRALTCRSHTFSLEGNQRRGESRLDGSGSCAQSLSPVAKLSVRTILASSKEGTNVRGLPTGSRALHRLSLTCTVRLCE